MFSQNTSPAERHSLRHPLPTFPSKTLFTQSDKKPERDNRKKQRMKGEKASAVVEVIPDERGKVEHRKMRKKERS